MLHWLPSAPFTPVHSKAFHSVANLVEVEWRFRSFGGLGLKISQ